MAPLLEVRDLTLRAGRRTLLKGLSLRLEPGQRRTVPGRGGRSLCLALAGDPECRVAAGGVLYEGTDLLALGPDERARRGILLAAGPIPRLAGVTVAGLLREAAAGRDQPGVSGRGFRQALGQRLASLGLGEEFAARDLGAGFSPKETVLFSALQIALLRPRLLLLADLRAGLAAASRRSLAAAVAAAIPAGTAVVDDGSV